MLSEKSQREKDKYYMVSLLSSILKKKKKIKLKETENRMVVSRGWGWGWGQEEMGRAW